MPFVPDTGVLALCARMLLAACLALAVWAVMVGLPAERRRCIFTRRPLWPLRWLQGEYPLSVTLLTGGPLAAVVLWWLSAAGVGPTGVWLPLTGALWCLLLAVALLNAARKSQPEGAACAGLVMLVTLLLLAGGALVVHALPALMLPGAG